MAKRKTKKSAILWQVVHTTKSLDAAEAWLRMRGYQAVPGSYDSTLAHWSTWRTGTGWQAKILKTSEMGSYEIMAEVGNTSAARPNPRRHKRATRRSKKNSRRAKRTSRRNKRKSRRKRTSRKR